MGLGSQTKILANALRYIMSNFGHIVNFVCSKELQEPMKPLVCPLQGERMEVNFGLQKIKESKYGYQKIHNETSDYSSCIKR